MNPRSLALQALLMAGVLFGSVATAQGEWEMRVCADPDNLPYSSRQLDGFDNRIAAILAAELGAELSWSWIQIDEFAVRTHLRTGECDVMLGVAEGAAGVISTVPYYRAPFVFVQRSSMPRTITSLDDTALHGLRIAVPPNTLLHKALLDMGLQTSYLPVQPDRSVRGPERSAPLVDAVLRNEADVAILFAPEASLLASRHSGQLTLTPVRSDLLPTLLPMYRITTIGVRAGDEALRDRLNIALASRWDEVQAVLPGYGIPVLPVPRPTQPATARDNMLPIGVILPLPSRKPALADVAATAADTGVLLAESMIARIAGDGTPELKLLLSSSPTLESAVRAAARLTATENVTALVGGMGDDTAHALSQLAEERNVLFFNIGATADRLRQQCPGNTLHVEASAAMYLDALAAWYGNGGLQEWYFVYEDSSEGRALLERMRIALGRAAEAGSAALPAGFGSYGHVIDDILAADPDVLLVLLAPVGQELFLSQAELARLDLRATGFPHPLMQTRDFLTRLRQSAPLASSNPRPALWDPLLVEHGAAELNERFASISGEPMDAAGWSAYAAIRIAFDSAVAAGSAEPAELLAWLRNPAAAFDLAKGEPVAFRITDQQLLQPLYMVASDPDSSWGRLVSERINLGLVAGEISSESGVVPPGPAGSRDDNGSCNDRG
jgi:ABC-type branched-subunit amino acid transport system substrate-binding protein/ABC-type amino acid transport substrate-binding protein